MPKVVNVWTPLKSDVTELQVALTWNSYVEDNVKPVKLLEFTVEVVVVQVGVPTNLYLILYKLAPITLSQRMITDVVVIASAVKFESVDEVESGDNKTSDKTIVW